MVSSRTYREGTTVADLGAVSLWIALALSAYALMGSRSFSFILRFEIAGSNPIPLRGVVAYHLEALHVPPLR